MNIISFSLFGNNDFYLRGAVMNARLVRVFYPQWTAFFYVNTKVKVDVIKELRGEGAEIRVGYLDDKRLWRLQALKEPKAERVIFRDADSRLNMREACAVAEWIASKLPFHSTHDHPCHQRWPLMGGMWGAVAPVFPGYNNLIPLIEKPVHHTDDQLFLKRHVWPLIKHKTFVHDLCAGNFPPLDGEAFVGERVDEKEAGCQKARAQRNKWIVANLKKVCPNL